MGYSWISAIVPASIKLGAEAVRLKGGMGLGIDQKIIENNSLIDREAFERSLEAAEALAEIDIRPRQYDLLPPSQRGAPATTPRLGWGLLEGAA